MRIVQGKNLFKIIIGFIGTAFIFTIIYCIGKYTFESFIAFLLVSLLIIIFLLLRKSFLTVHHSVKDKIEDKRTIRENIRLEKEKLAKIRENRTKIFTENLSLVRDKKINLLLFKDREKGKFVQIRLYEENENVIELCITKASLLAEEEAKLKNLDITWEQSTDSYICFFGDEIPEAVLFMEKLFIDIFGLKKDLEIEPVILF